MNEYPDDIDIKEMEYPFDQFIADVEYAISMDPNICN